MTDTATKLRFLLHEESLQHGWDKVQGRYGLLLNRVGQTGWIAMLARRGERQACSCYERPKEFPNRNIKTIWRLLENNIFLLQQIG
jgi:hypothetical protein